MLNLILCLVYYVCFMERHKEELIAVVVKCTILFKYCINKSDFGTLVRFAQNPPINAHADIGWHIQQSLSSKL